MVVAGEGRELAARYTSSHPGIPTINDIKSNKTTTIAPRLS
jgi:hypothetical protein